MGTRQSTAIITGVQDTTDSDRVGLAFFTNPDGSGATAADEVMRISSSGNVGIGTSSPSSKLDVEGNIKTSHSTGNSINLNHDGVNGAITNVGGDFLLYANGTQAMIAHTNGTEAMRIDSSGNVGIGTSSPKLNANSGTFLSVINASGNGWLEVGTGSTTDGLGGAITFNNTNVVGTDKRVAQISSTRAGANNTANLLFSTANASSITERMRIDSSGNLLVGKTSVGFGTAGIELRADNSVYVTRSANTPVYVNRLSTDGDIVQFSKDGSKVGSIASVSYGMQIYATGVNNTGWTFGDGSAVLPMKNSALSDNFVDLGSASYRMDDIYATNGTIQTSDQNEKQDIAELSDAEQRVAVAAKGLLRKFRWKDAVAEKGDEARTHFGIIAQDLQAAFAAEGLDASDYAMFIHTTWTDEETGEERSRMGVRYSELLAFIIAAI
jgi:hypothetical protein